MSVASRSALEGQKKEHISLKYGCPSNHSWIFIGRTDAILWPPDAKSRLIRKDPDAGRDWGQEEKGMTEDEMWMALLTQWTWVWASSGRWWRTGKPGLLQSIGSQRVRHSWATEQQQHLPEHHEFGDFPAPPRLSAQPVSPLSFHLHLFPIPLLSDWMGTHAVYLKHREMCWVDVTRPLAMWYYPQEFLYTFGMKDGRQWVMNQ